MARKRPKDDRVAPGLREALAAKYREFDRRWGGHTVVKYGPHAGQPAPGAGAYLRRAAALEAGELVEMHAWELGDRRPAGIDINDWVRLERDDTVTVLRSSLQARDDDR